jgi:hypothetical protein
MATWLYQIASKNQANLLGFSQSVIIQIHPFPTLLTGGNNECCVPCDGAIL